MSKGHLSLDIWLKTPYQAKSIEDMMRKIWVEKAYYW